MSEDNVVPIKPKSGSVPVNDEADVLSNLLMFCERLDRTLTYATEVLGNLELRVRRLERERQDDKRKPTILGANGARAN